MPKNSFWRGSRGEWYLVVQAGLFLLLILSPTCQWQSEWKLPFTWIGSILGGILFLLGTILAASGSVNLGRNLTPLPLPKTNAPLIITGAYRFVRHPIYSGLSFMAFGWGLWLHNFTTIGLAFLLFVFFDIKSRFEERLLLEKFPKYLEYRQRVRKLLPFVY